MHGFLQAWAKKIPASATIAPFKPRVKGTYKWGEFSLLTSISVLHCLWSSAFNSYNFRSSINCIPKNLVYLTRVRRRFIYLGRRHRRTPWAWYRSTNCIIIFIYIIYRNRSWWIFPSKSPWLGRSLHFKKRLWLCPHVSLEYFRIIIFMGFGI